MRPRTRPRMGARLQVQGTQASLPCRIPSPSWGLRAIKEEGTHQLLSFPELLVSELGWLEPWPPPVVEVRFAPPPALGACALLEVSQCSVRRRVAASLCGNWVAKYIKLCGPLWGSSHLLPCSIYVYGIFLPQ